MGGPSTGCPGAPHGTVGKDSASQQRGLRGRDCEVGRIGPFITAVPSEEMDNEMCNY